MRSSTIVISTLSALVAGVAIGVLTSPCSGKETRQKVTEKAKDIRKKILGFANRPGYNVEDVKQLLAEDIEGLHSDLKERIIQMIELSQKKMY